MSEAVAGNPDCERVAGAPTHTQIHRESAACALITQRRLECGR